MTLQIINIGTVPNDPLTDVIQQAYAKINANFASLPAGSAASGPTGARPTSPALGQSYFDTTLGFRIDWNGFNWVNAEGGLV